MREIKPLRTQKVKAGLKTKLIARTIHYFRQVTSTNDIAKELALKRAREGTVIVAETQIKGRGRLGRVWASPKGGIWFSVILRPRVNVKDAPKLTLMTSVAVAKTINKLFDLKAEIKWPNDILINRKKVCGILTETSTRGNMTDFFVVGVGINANIDLNCLPKNLRNSVTSLKKELKGEIEREHLLRAVLEEIEHYYTMFTRERFNAILAEWRNLAKFLGSYVEVASFKEKIVGQATDVDESGALLIRLNDGTIKRVLAGDVTVLRWQ